MAVQCTVYSVYSITAYSLTCYKSLQPVLNTQPNAAQHDAMPQSSLRSGRRSQIGSPPSGIKGMLRGEKKRLHVPSKLAYGAAGAPPDTGERRE